MNRKRNLKKVLARFFFIFSIIGPGLITASADNDAPGIATYSLVGSTYGYKFLWILVFITIGEVVVQEMAARMGTVTGKGTADLIREQFGVKVTTFAMATLLLANFGTTVAQFAGVAGAAELFGLSRYVVVPLAGLLVGFLVLRGSYEYVEKVLIFLSLAALSYIVSAFTANPDWELVLQRAVVPTVVLDREFIFAVLATVGTTITPWAIVYMQASVTDKGIDPSRYRYARLDVVLGAVWGNVVSAFIIIATAATLFAIGLPVDSAADAALALEPVAGAGARYLFSVGLLGASLLAASVLPLSTTYAVCEAFGWERGLDNPPREAPIFYGIYVAFIVLGVFVVLIPNIPLFPLMWLSQALNAILLPVLLVLVLRLVNDSKLMGAWTNSWLQNAFVYGLTLAIGLITLTLLVSPLLEGGQASF